MIRLCLVLCCIASFASAQIELPDVDAPATGKLVAEYKSVAPGGSLWVGVLITMKPKWHVYWSNPGDSGMPPKVKWTLPKGVTISELVWPVPRPIPVEPLMTYGYDDEVLLAAQLRVPKDWEAKTIKLGVQATWLVCTDVCLEGSMREEVEVSVEKTEAPAWTKFTQKFRDARRTYPTRPRAGAVRAVPTGLSIDLEKLPIDKKARVFFFPSEAGWMEHAARQLLTRESKRVHLALPLTESGKKRKNRIVRGVLVIRSAASRRAYTLDLPVKPIQPEGDSK